MATIGFIGSGHIGSQLARLAISQGHDVVLSNSRGAETLAEPALNEAIREGDILVLLCPDDQIDDIPCDSPPRDRSPRR